MKKSSPSKIIFTIIGALILFSGIIYAIYFLQNQKTAVAVNFVVNGDNFIATHKYSEALAEYQKSITNGDKNEGTYLKVADIYWKKNLRDDAIKTLEKCYEECSYDQKTLTKLISYGIVMKNYDSIVKYTDELVKQNPNSTTLDSLEIIKFSALSSLGKTDDAKNSLEKYIGDKTSNNEILNYTMALISYADINKSRSFMTNFADYKTNPKFMALSSLLDKVQADTDNKNSSTNNSNIARLMILNSTIPGFTLKVLDEDVKFENINMNPYAIAIMNDIIKTYPDYFASYELRGIGYFQNGQYDLAIVDFDKTILLNPDDIIAHLYNARIYSTQNNPDKSTKEYSLAQSLSNNDTSILHEYILMLTKYGFFTQASEKYKELIKIGGQSKDNFEYNVEYVELTVEKQSKYQDVQTILNNITNQWDPLKIWKKEERPDLYKKIDYYNWYAKYQIDLAPLIGKNDTLGNPLENEAFYLKQYAIIKKLNADYPYDAKISYAQADIEVALSKFQTAKENKDNYVLLAKTNYQLAIDYDMANTITQEAKIKITNLTN